ncbi:phosphatidylinositol kinase (PIK-H1) [Achlya hypogyna]|uniref:1-phosphatidylinositol 4-kinase n=1 Tax=Achlya hypogyna TaxID=1202772 RepID=A0A1V9ZIH7_ACHHY|nr:phosphatidylinositol kinase (PIK-H1) [Achlya hypogyna]
MEATAVALPPAPAATPPNARVYGSIVANGVIDMQSLMQSLWKHRKDAAYTQAVCEELRSIMHTRPMLDQVDFYLPQLAHMVLHLEKELPMDAMEQFVMLLCLSSTHFALQFFWIVYATLDEHRPKRNGNPRTFTRCAQLLVILEQCLVYGSPVSKQAQELLAQKHISRMEMDVILKADRRFFAAQSSAAISTNEETAEGWLFKKGGGTTKLGRRSWHRRWCRIERKILFVYNHRMDMHARNAIPLERASIRILENAKHPHYFEIHHGYSDTTFKFAASSDENLASWVESLTAAAAPPLPPASSPTKAGPARAITRMSEAMRQFILHDEASDKSNEVLSAAPVDDEKLHVRSTSVSSQSSLGVPVLTDEQQARYDFFTDQIQFVKAITDVCEELRLVEVTQRKGLLSQKLAHLQSTIPAFAYLPLCSSTELFSRVTSVCVDDGYVFKTHERAPVLMHFLSMPSDERHDVSSALFAHLHTESSDQGLDMISLEANTQLCGQTEFMKQLLEDETRREKLVSIFGELKEIKAARLTEANPGCLVQSLIAKSYDDLRQEVLVMQLIAYMDDIFTKARLPLRLHPYRILSTGASTGLIEVVSNATSLDGLKKSDGFQSLRQYFEAVYGDPSGALFQQAIANYIESLAAYSIVSYVLCIKDRHNGNILLDIEGHIVHIDFGFFLGRAPGGTFSLETAPFKLTAEMVDCFGGKDGTNYQRFVELCSQAAVAIRQHGDVMYTMVEVMSFNSKLPCFQGNVPHILQAFKERLFLTTPEDKVGAFVKGLVDKAYDHFGTTKYDQFQEYSNGIHK